MSIVDITDGELAVKLRHLDAAGPDLAPEFDYLGLLDRHAARRARTRRRAAVARGAASAVVIAMVAVSLWRLDRTELSSAPLAVSRNVAPTDAPPEPRLVRADTFLALAAIEDHIATIDDALSDARTFAPGGADVARLERTRAELLDSYTRVRYADLVAANF